MVTLAVNTDNQVELSRQGYAINEWYGFDDHWIPIYAHHPVSDKKVGDVVFKVRVGDPRTLNNGEANYIARKAAQGYFAWKPGDECLKRTFKNVEFKRRPLGGVERIEHESTKGCQWCRERAEDPFLSAEPVAAVAPPPATPPAPVIPEYDVLHCSKCPEVFIGDNAMNERRGHLMREHQNKTGTTRRRKKRSVPDKGSAKETVE